MGRAAGDSPFYEFQVRLVRKGGKGEADVIEEPFVVKLPSVSTVLDVLNKPAIAGWYWKVTVEGVHELLRDEELDLQQVRTWSVDDLKAELKARKLRPYDRRDKRAEEGTDAHDALERIALGEFEAGELLKDQSPWVRSLAQWVHVNQPHFLSSETTVASFWHGFAGTLDFVWRDADGARWLTDLKTSARVYDEHHYQDNAYRIAWNEQHPDERIDRISILHATADGQMAQDNEIAVNERTFLSVLEAHKALQEGKAA